MIGNSALFGFRATGAILATAFSEQRKSVSIEYRILIVQLMVMLLAVFFFASTVTASDFSLTTKHQSEKLSLYTSLYTKHFDPEPEHVNDQNMLGFEVDSDTRWLWGFARFDNSFGQESHYLYLGQKWRAFDSDQWYYKVTGGLLHGYKEPYEDKIPFNDLGIAPAIIPGLGYRNKSFFAEYAQLGLSGGLVTVGVKF